MNPRAGFCRPTPLAGAPLQPLEYYSSPESSFHMYETHNELYRRGYRLSNLCFPLFLCRFALFRVEMCFSHQPSFRALPHRRSGSAEISRGSTADQLGIILRSVSREEISQPGSFSGSHPSLPPASARVSRECAVRRSDIWGSGAHGSAVPSVPPLHCCSGRY